MNLLALLAFMLLASCGGGGDAPLSSAKELTTFSFAKNNNTALATDIAGTVAGDTIMVTLPYGVDRSALVASYTSLGVSVKVGARLQTSGVTSENFSKPVSYEVKAADGSLKYYTVTVVNAPITAKDITRFAFTPAANSGLASTIEGAISGDAIGVVLPQGVSRSALISTFSSTGASVGVGGALQNTGITVHDFSSPVLYTATAADGSSKNYTVTVGNAATSAAQITSFAVLGINANITGTSINLTLPFGVSRSALVASFSSTGASVKVAGKEQVSGSSSNNFDAALVYTVTAADGGTSTYTVVITNLLNNANDISAFSVAGVGGNIVGTAISVTLPYGMARTALVASFSSTGDTVKVGAQLQTSGLTSNSFAAPLIYTVTAQDGSTKNYTVTVGNAANSAKDITAFSVLGVNGSIAGSAITVTLPYGTDRTALVASFVSTGNTVSVGGTVQSSGTSGNNFNNPVVYTVTADDGSTKPYTVTITNALNPAKDITAFSVLGVNGTVSGSAITVTLPYGTNRTALVAAFASTGATVSVGGTTQASGSTSNNFSNPVTYTVTAENGTTQNYIVTVSIALNPAKEISTYSIAGVNGTILGTSISVILPTGTNRTALVATFSSTGASVKVGNTAQTSGLTRNDYTSPLTYTVAAEDGSTATYTVAIATASFVGDWEAGITGVGNWRNIQTVAPNRFQRVTSPVRQGIYAARVEVRPGDDPINSSGERAEVLTMTDANGNPINENESSGTQYYAFSVRLDPSWQAPVGDTNGKWATVYQLHGPDIFHTNPAFAVNVQDGFTIYLAGGDLDDATKSLRKSYPFTNSNLNLGRWVDLVIRIKFAKDFTGTVDVWRRDEGQGNYAQVLSLNGVPTLQYRSSQGPVGDHYWKHGLYRSKESSITNILWLDGLTRYSYN